MIFVDSSAWYALSTSRDENHVAAAQFVAALKEPFVTSDFAVDETDRRSSSWTAAGNGTTYLVCEHLIRSRLQVRINQILNHLLRPTLVRRGISNIKWLPGESSR